MLGVSFTITGMRVVRLAPAGDHLDVFRHLADGGAHAALAHAVRAAEVELDAVGAGLLDRGQDRLPARLVAGDHERDDHRAVGVVALDDLDLAEVGLQRPVGDELDVVEAEEPAVGAPDRAVARAVDVDDVRVEAEGLPDHPAPAGLEGAADVVFLVGRRGGGEPEGVRGLDPDEIAAQVGHGVPPSSSGCRQLRNVHANSLNRALARRGRRRSRNAADDAARLPRQ